MNRCFGIAVWGALALGGALLTGTVWAADSPNEGMLQVVDKDRQPKGLCPLQHTDVQAEIAGFIARVTVTQQFANPYPDTIEAVYTFPLSERGAVDRMTMRIGDRTIRGVVKERGEARKVYEEAVRQGKTASLLDQERPNIFTQSVGNIPPGAKIDITLSYVEYVKFEDGAYHFAFPMTVGPRYVPGQPQGAGTTQVPDAQRITPPMTPEGTRAGHDIALSVSLDPGLPIRDLHSELHEVRIDRPSEQQAKVRLVEQNTIPNRDFMLTYRVGGESVGDAVLTHIGAKGGFVSLVLQPPARVAPEAATPKEMIFVIDCSGSMNGFPIAKAKETMRGCIERMNPRDTFNLISFSGGTGQCFEHPVENSPENRQQALTYLNTLQGSGGTEMMNAIRAAYAGTCAEDRLRIVCFMSDGFVGNDMEIIGAVKDASANARMFAFGVGNSVNRFLIEQMASAGRGASEIVALEAKGAEAAKRFQERIQNPVLTDIHVDLGGLNIEDVYPKPDALPDLFSAQPLVLTGRYAHAGEGDIVLRGRTATGPFERKIHVRLPEQNPEHNVLASLWARAKIDALMAKDWQGAQRGNPAPEIKSEIVRLGVDFSLATQYTSFVAVEERVVNEGGQPRRVEVPIDMADGVSYEGVYGAPSLAQVHMKCKSGMPVLGGDATDTSARGTKSMDTATFGYGHMLPEKSIPIPMEAAKAAPAIASTANPKLDTALQQLVTTGLKDTLRLSDGRVQVVVTLSDDSDANLSALKTLHLRVVSVKHSSKRVLAWLDPADLNTLAAFGFVTKVEAAP